MEREPLSKSLYIALCKNRVNFDGAYTAGKMMEERLQRGWPFEPVEVMVVNKVRFRRERNSPDISEAISFYLILDTVFLFAPTSSCLR